VIVVEERGGVLEGGIVARLGMTWEGPLVGVSIAGRGGASAVEVNDGPHIGNVVTCPVESVIDRKEMACWQTILPLDDHAAGTGCFERWAGKTSADGPHVGRGQVAVNVNGGLRDGKTVERNLGTGVVRIRKATNRLRYRGNEQRVDEGMERG
jgi:hypothetical protein